MCVREFVGNLEELARSDRKQCKCSREVIVFTAVVLAAAVRIVRFKAGLRVHLAVTWLTVYRQLHMCGLEVFDDGLLAMALYVCSEASKSPRES